MTKKWNYTSEGVLPEARKMNTSDRVIVAVEGCPYVQAGWYDHDQKAWFIDTSRYPVPVYAWHYDKPPRVKA